MGNKQPWNLGDTRLYHLDRAKRICYLSPMRAAKVQASLRIRAVSPEPPLLAHTSSESRGTFRQKARSIAPLNGWACAVEICHDGMLEDTNSLDGAHLSAFILWQWNMFKLLYYWTKVWPLPCLSGKLNWRQSWSVLHINNFCFAIVAMTMLELHRITS